MDEVFGDSTGLGQADIERQKAIQRRLGLIDGPAEQSGEKDRSSGSMSQEATKWSRGEFKRQINYWVELE